MEETTFDIALGGYKIYQAPNTTTTQMMSYLITTPNNKLIVIDGGLREDANYLIDKIHELGLVVSIWIITHMHYDHYGAFVEILERPNRENIVIEKLCYNFPPFKWVNMAEPRFYEKNKALYELLPQFKSITQILKEKDKCNIDGLVIDILKVPDDYEDYYPPYGTGSPVNDTSIAFKILFPNGKSALFLGDLGFGAGQKLAKKYKEELKSDIVQMAHHGQNGAGEDLYKYVKPTICMWCAPMWLYDNNIGLFDKNAVNKFNSHHFKTVIVRGWMDKLNVKMHAVEGKGLAIIK